MGALSDERAAIIGCIAYPAEELLAASYLGLRIGLQSFLRPSEYCLIIPKGYLRLGKNDPSRTHRVNLIIWHRPTFVFVN